MAVVHQALDQAQPLDLIGWVQTLAARAALGRGEAVAAFPHAQHVFREADVAFDGGDGKV